MPNGFPPGFKLRQGLDGLILGVSIVFLVRVQMIFSSLVDWRIVPEWAYQPIKSALKSLGRGLQETMQAVTSPFGSGEVAGTGIGATGATGGGGAASSGSLLNTPVIGTFLKAIGSPLVIVGGLDASIVQQLLIILGFWIAVLVPLWFWGLRPLLFWWRSTDVFETPNPE